MKYAPEAERFIEYLGPNLGGLTRLCLDRWYELPADGRPEITLSMAVDAARWGVDVIAGDATAGADFKPSPTGRSVLLRNYLDYLNQKIESERGETC